MDESMEPTKSEQNEIEKLLKAVQKIEPKIRRKHKPKSFTDQQKLSVAIANRLSEYCDCYMLFGFDNNGNPMVLINSANNLEQRALSDLLMDFVNESMTDTMEDDEDYED
jgi:hypothetical protein